MNRTETRAEFRVLIRRPDGSRYTEWRLTPEAVDRLSLSLPAGYTVESAVLELRTLDW